MLQKIEKPVLEDLQKREIVLSQNSKSVSTRKNYRTDWKKFLQFCEDTNLCALPAEPDTIRMFLVWLDKIGRKPSTIQRIMTSIRQAHLLSGYQNPITAVVSETAKGIFRTRGILRSKKSALTADKLERILKFIPDTFAGIRDRAILLVGWTGGLRRSEIVSIDVEDIEPQTQGIVITIRKSKTDQYGKGHRIGLPYVDKNQSFCSARALRNWMIKAEDMTSGPVFRSIGKYDQEIPYPGTKGRLSDKQVNRILKKYAELAGYNPSEFGAHSLRSGLATTLASIGIEERKIMNITGHKSLPILREYIERGELFTDHPILALFSI